MPAKRRMIHESFFQSERVAAWSMRQRLLVLGMISIADDQGRLKGNPFWLKAQIFMYDAVSPDDIAGDLATVAASNDTIRLYRADGVDYIQLVNWWEYQSLQWAKISDYPPPEEWRDRVRQMFYKPERWILTSNWPGTPDRLAYDESVTLASLLGDGISLSSYLMSSGIININTNTNVDIPSKKGGVGGNIPAEYRSVLNG